MILTLEEGISSNREDIEIWAKEEGLRDEVVGAGGGSGMSGLVCAIVKKKLRKVAWDNIVWLVFG